MKMKPTFSVSLIFIVLAVSHLTCAVENSQEESLRTGAESEDFIPPPRPYTSHRVLIQSDHHCFKLLYHAHGMRPGFKGWKHRGQSGYIVMNGSMYLFYRCNKAHSSYSSIPLPRPYSSIPLPRPY